MGTAKLEVQRSEVVSRIDAEKNKLNLEAAEASLKQLRQTYDLKRKADAADLHLLEIKRDRARSAMTARPAELREDGDLFLPWMGWSF